MSLSGNTLELVKSRYDPYTLDAELGELLQVKPFAPTWYKPPVLLMRIPEAGILLQLVVGERGGVNVPVGDRLLRNARFYSGPGDGGGDVA